MNEAIAKRYRRTFHDDNPDTYVWFLMCGGYYIEFSAAFLETKGEYAFAIWAQKDGEQLDSNKMREAGEKMKDAFIGMADPEGAHIYFLSKLEDLLKHIMGQNHDH